MAKGSKEEAVQWYAQNRGLYKKLSQKIHNIIVELLEESNITIHAVTSRSKDVDSFKKKIEDSKYTSPTAQITDLSGIRIIAYVEDDLKPICKIIEDSFNIDITNSTDKSEELGVDKVGYKSIHYICEIKDDRLVLSEYKKFKNLKFEIQIRTILQHAWAEIEHDRNYKFNGVLPAEIKRRFKILAGTLELVDREFNQLSKDIDKISDSVVIADENDELNKIPLSTTTLKQFLISRFQNEINKGLIVPDFYNSSDEVINELNDYGIQNLKDLDNIIPPDFLKNVKKAFSVNKPATFLGLIRDIMIVNNYRNYFDLAWKNKWDWIDDGACKLYKLYKLDTEKLISEYNLFELIN